MRTTVRFAAVLLGCMAALCASARDARHLIVRTPGDAGSVQAATRVHLGVDLRMAADIVRSRDANVTVALPLAGIGTQDVELHASTAITPATRIRLATPDGEKVLDAGAFAAYSGSIPSMPGSVVTMVVADGEVTATVDMGHENWTLGRDGAVVPVQKGMAPYVMTKMARAVASCVTTEKDVPTEVLRAMHAKPTDAVQAGNDTLDLEVSVEADYQWYTKFRKDRTAALAHIARILALTDEIYRRDFHVRVVTTDVYLWTTEDDGYDDRQSVFEVLQDFMARYPKEHSAVRRDIAMFMTSRPNGNVGGIAASIGGICTTGSYCAGSVMGDFPDDTDATNSFDAVIFPHEIGHVCGGVHTQSCAWNGGPLDSCIVSESGDCVTSEMTRPRIGTLMSYCHQTYTQGGGTELEFHPRHKAVIRSYLNRAECIGGKAADRTARLHGRVIHAITRQPLEGVWLDINPYDNNVPEQQKDNRVATDADGIYMIDSLSTGLYVMTIYGDYSIPNRPAPLYGGSLAGLMEIDADDMIRDIELIPSSTVNMNIVGSQSEPNRQVMVTIVREDIPDLHQNITLPVQYLTNISWVFPPGTYTVVPISKDIDFEPLMRTFVVDTNATHHVLDFTLVPAGMNGYRCIALTGRYASGMRTLRGRDTVAVILGTDTLDMISDTNGIVLSEPLPQKTRYGILYKTDTSRSVQAQRTAQYWDPGTDTVPVFLSRDRTSPGFTHTYRFETSNRIYRPLEQGTEVFGPTPALGYARKVLLPWAQTTGQQASATMWIYAAGAVSFGNAPLPASAHYHTATEDVNMVISAFNGPLARDTSTDVRVQYSIVGEAPARTVVVQWSGFRIPFTSSWEAPVTTYAGPVEFQLAIDEASGRIDVTYGDMPDVEEESSEIEYAVGLRGRDVVDNQTVMVDVRHPWVAPVVSQRGVARAKALVAPGLLPHRGQVYSWILGTTAVEGTESAESAWSIAPSPASSHMTIDAGGYPADVRIMDMNGRTLTHARDTYDVDVSMLASGAYILRVDSMGRSRHFPITIVR